MFTRDPNQVLDSGDRHRMDLGVLCPLNQSSSTPAPGIGTGAGGGEAAGVVGVVGSTLGAGSLVAAPDPVDWTGVVGVAASESFPVVAAAIGSPAISAAAPRTRTFFFIRLCPTSTSRPGSPCAEARVVATAVFRLHPSQGGIRAVAASP